MPGQKGDEMKFMAVWTSGPEVRDEALERFKSTGGGPPAGVTMLGRWHDVSGGGGFALGETNDVSLIYKWILDWSDLLAFDVVPVVDDAEFGQILS